MRHGDLAALRTVQPFPVPSVPRQSWRDFILSIPRGGSGGVLSGLFFGDIICHSRVLSACIGLLVPPRYVRRIIALLQGRYKPYKGRFPGVATAPRPERSPALHRLGGFQMVASLSRGGNFQSRNPADFHPDFEKIFFANFSSDFSPVIVDSR